MHTWFKNNREKYDFYYLVLYIISYSSQIYNAMNFNKYILYNKCYELLISYTVYLNLLCLLSDDVPMNNSSKFSNIAIIGGASGGAALLIVVLCIVVLLCKRCHGKEQYLLNAGNAIKDATSDHNNTNTIHLYSTIKPAGLNLPITTKTQKHEYDHIELDELQQLGLENDNKMDINASHGVNTGTAPFGTKVKADSESSHTYWYN